MEENNLDLTPPSDLLNEFDPGMLKKARTKDDRKLIGWLMRGNRADMDSLQLHMKKNYPGIQLFFIRVYEPNETVYMVSRTEMENARIEKNRAEIEERVKLS